MNQDRFIELLNLYLDEEISAADYSDLMLEVSGDPERQKIFEEYTRCLLYTSPSPRDRG